MESLELFARWQRALWLHVKVGSRSWIFTLRALQWDASRDMSCELLLAVEHSASCVPKKTMRALLVVLCNMPWCGQ